MQEHFIHSSSLEGKWQCCSGGSAAAGEFPILWRQHLLQHTGGLQELLWGFLPAVDLLRSAPRQQLGSLRAYASRGNNGQMQRTSGTSVKAFNAVLPKTNGKAMSTHVTPEHAHVTKLFFIWCLLHFSTRLCHLNWFWKQWDQCESQLFFYLISFKFIKKHQKDGSDKHKQNSPSPLCPVFLFLMDDKFYIHCPTNLLSQGSRCHSSNEVC